MIQFFQVYLYCLLSFLYWIFCSANLSDIHLRIRSVFLRFYLSCLSLCKNWNPLSVYISSVNEKLAEMWTKYTTWYPSTPQVCLPQTGWIGTLFTSEPFENFRLFRLNSISFSVKTDVQYVISGEMFVAPWVHITTDLNTELGSLLFWPSPIFDKLNAEASHPIEVNVFLTEVCKTDCPNADLLLCLSAVDSYEHLGVTHTRRCTARIPITKSLDWRNEKTVGNAGRLSIVDESLPVKRARETFRGRPRSAFG